MLIDRRYNSIVFNTISANAYETAIVSEDFTKTSGLVFQNGTFNHLDNFQRLEKEECLKAYLHPFLSTWGDLLIVTSQHTNASGVLYSWFTNPGEPTTSWTTSNPKQRPLYISVSPGPGSGAGLEFEVAYCLAEPTEPHCKVEIAVFLLLGVVICNVIKVLCFITVFANWSFEPLATVGDAVSSFLSEPDPATKGLNLLSEHDLRRLDCRSRYNKRRHQSRVLEGSTVDATEHASTFSRLQYDSTVKPATYHRRRRRWYHANEFTGWWQLQLM